MALKISDLGTTLHTVVTPFDHQMTKKVEINRVISFSQKS